MQLLKITTIPIEYEMSAKPARLQYNNDRGSFKVNKQGGTFNMRSRITQVRLDTYERRSSLGWKGIKAASDDAVERGKQAASEAIARYAELGNQMAQAHKGANLPDIITNRMMQDSHRELALVPISGIDISWFPGSLDVEYNPVKLDFDWEAARTSLEFIPGNFSINITQYPKIQIEYLGKPNYVPPSASPDYQAK